jgi:mutator protein MutT
MLQKLLNLFENKILKQTAWIIIVYQGKILLGKRSKFCNNPGQWNFPGGTIDPNENPKQAAQRETKEETNLDVLNLKFLQKIQNSYYFVAYVNDLSRLKITKETEKYKLVDANKLPKNLHYSVKLFLTKNSLDNL